MRRAKRPVVLTDLGKICTGCDQDLPLSAYYKQDSGKLGLRSECKVCWRGRIRAAEDADPGTKAARDRAWRKANPERQKAIYRRNNLKRNYGITAEEYGRMLEAQGGRCAGCGRTDSGDRRNVSLAVDHDHKTGKVRGLLCSPCNRVLGKVDDSPDRLMALAAYLLQHSDVLSECIGASA
jgi:hypothetical protein